MKIYILCKHLSMFKRVTTVIVALACEIENKIYATDILMSVCKKQRYGFSILCSIYQSPHSRQLGYARDLLHCVQVKEMSTSCGQ